MKNYKKSLLPPLSVLGLLTSFLCFSEPTVKIAVRPVAKPAIPKTPSVNASNSFKTPSRSQHESAPRDHQQTNANHQSVPANTSITNSNQIAFKTPVEVLEHTLLEKSGNYKKTFTELNNKFNSLKMSNNPMQSKLTNQARTLLVRAHPELIQGLSQNLAYLPNRFMSYFKEKLPALSTRTGRERFTQSVIMETIKSMPTNSSSYIDYLEAHPNTLFESPANAARIKQEHAQDFRKKYSDQVNAISKKYGGELEHATTPAMFMQWSRNIITEVALLAPRAAGATAGAAIGAASKVAGVAITGTINSANAGANAGFAIADTMVTGGKNNRKIIESANDFLRENVENHNEISSPFKEFQLDANKIQLNPKHFTKNIESRTNARAALDSAIGVTGGAVTGALVTGTALANTALYLPDAAINGAVSGAAVGANAFENVGRYAYKKVSTSLKPKNRNNESPDLNNE